MGNQWSQGKVLVTLVGAIFIGILMMTYLPGLLPKTPAQQGTIITTVVGGGIVTTTVGTGGTPTNNYQIGLLYTESISTSGATASTTSPSYVVYNSNGRRLSSVSSLYGEAGGAIATGATATVFNVYPSDGDYLFIKVDTGTAEYPDVAKIMSSNPMFVDWKWIPVAAATVPDFVVEMKISNMGTPNYQVSPSISGKIKFQCQPDDLSLTLSAPADQLVLGIVSGTDVYVTWTLSALSTSQGMCLAKLYFTTNQTATDYGMQDLTITASSNIVLMKTAQNLGTTYTMNLPASTSQNTAGITTYWRYWPLNADVATDISEGLLIMRGTSDADSIQFRAHYKTYFTSVGHEATTVFCYRLISAADGLQTAATDTVSIGG